MAENLDQGKEAIKQVVAALKAAFKK